MHHAVQLSGVVMCARIQASVQLPTVKVGSCSVLVLCATGTAAFRVHKECAALTALHSCIAHGVCHMLTGLVLLFGCPSPLCTCFCALPPAHSLSPTLSTPACRLSRLLLSQLLSVATAALGVQSVGRWLQPLCGVL